MELNGDTIIKALDCFHKRILSTELANKVYESEISAVIDALSLIKELTEEIERLKELGTKKEIEKELVRRETKADTIREMQRITKEQSFKYRHLGEIVYVEDIDQTAKEMLEEIEK